MNWRKVFLALQSALCILLAVLLAAAAIGIYREGSAARAENPLAWIFTLETIAVRARPIAALLLAVLVLTAAGLALRIRPEDGGSARAVRVENKSADSAKTRRIVLLAAALLLVLAGICNGGARDVLAKAVKICTECVGLG